MSNNDNHKLTVKECILFFSMFPGDASVEFGTDSLTIEEPSPKIAGYFSNRHFYTYSSIGTAVENMIAKEAKASKKEFELKTKAAAKKD